MFFKKHSYILLKYALNILFIRLFCIYINLHNSYYVTYF
jgi:hypothetical protein